MAAGVGSRLMPLTTSVPKPMVPVANRPIMEYSINLLKRYNISDIITNLHYLPDSITNYFGEGSEFGINLAFSNEKELLGTAGGLKNNEWFFDQTFVVLSGDALTDINLDKMLAFHKEKNSLATIALKKSDRVENFGVVIIDQESRIKNFQEKPRTDEALSNLVNTGIYIFEPEIFSYIPKQEFFDFGRQLFPMLVEKGLPFCGYEMDDYWCDIGTLELYRQANEDVLHERLGVFGHIQSKINSYTHINGKVLIGDNVKIGKDVEVTGNVIIGNNCYIDDNVVLRNVIIWDDVRVESEAILNECIIGRGSTLEKGSNVGSGCVLSDYCLVQAHAKVNDGEKLEIGSVVQRLFVAR